MLESFPSARGLSDSDESSPKYHRTSVHHEENIVDDDPKSSKDDGSSEGSMDFEAILE